MESFTPELGLAVLIITIAALTQGATSFGFSLIAVPLLGILYPLQLVVPVLIIYSLILNSVVLYHLRDHIQLRKILLLAIFGILGTPFGVHLLQALEEAALQLIVGITIVVVAAVNFSGYQFSVKNESASFIPIGFLSGLLNGSVSLGGPPIVLFLNNQKVKKQQFRGNLTLYFWILNLFSIPTYIFSGLITEEVLHYSGIMLPGLIVGTLLGVRVGNYVNEQLFRRISMSLIMGMGFLSIWSAL